MRKSKFRLSELETLIPSIYEDKVIGKTPKDILSWDICNNYTEFVIYGSLIKETDDEFYTLNSHEWEIFGEIIRRS